MEMSIWIAKLLGPVFLAVSIPMIVSPQAIQEVADDFLKSRSLIYLSSVLVLVGGLAIVNTHNRWNFDWTLIITLFGWAMVIGGGSRIVAPKVITKVGGTMIGHSIATRVAGVAWALIGFCSRSKGIFDDAG